MLENESISKEYLINSHKHNIMFNDVSNGMQGNPINFLHRYHEKNISLDPTETIKWFLNLQSIIEDVPNLHLNKIFVIHSPRSNFALSSDSGVSSCNSDSSLQLSGGIEANGHPHKHHCAIGQLVTHRFSVFPSLVSKQARVSFRYLLKIL